MRTPQNYSILENVSNKFLITSIFDVLVHIISLDEPVIIIGIFLLLFGHSF